jgi:hypothetical protein
LSQETCQGYKLQFLRRTETLRPIPAFFNDNSRRCLFTRASLRSGIAATASGSNASIPTLNGVSDFRSGKREDPGYSRANVIVSQAHPHIRVAARMARRFVDLGLFAKSENPEDKGA